MINPETNPKLYTFFFKEQPPELTAETQRFRRSMGAFYHGQCSHNDFINSMFFFNKRVHEIGRQYHAPLQNVKLLDDNAHIDKMRCE
jgi:hypothetical protein